MHAVTLRGIAKRFDGGAPVLRGVDLAVEPGEFVVFVGPSGSGKSTLLRIVAGLEQADDGELSIGGRIANDVPPSQRGIAMVFQSYALYPHMTVRENMGFALRMAGTPRHEVDQRVRRSADILQIGELLDRKPKTLSGGQRQRVAIGRAIVREPRVFLFDEPLSNLDAALRQDMRVELSRLHRALGATMIYVTHDQVEAMTLAGRIVVFDRGAVQQVGTPPALYEDPANLFVAGFLGAPKMNLLPATLQWAGPVCAEVRLADGSGAQVAVDAARSPPGAAVTLGIRPEHLMLGEGLAARVALVEYLGDHRLVHVDAPWLTGSACLKLGADAAPLAAGDAVQLRLPPARCHLFDAAGVAYPRLPTR